MRILVVGDRIEDRYVFGEATRLCPEAPVPVIVPTRKRNSDGGAALVAAQLVELGTDVVTSYGSWSFKERIFAGSHLVCRVDNDAVGHMPITLDDEADAIVVSDYGKGALTEELARKIVATGKPVFVDAKHHWNWYMKEGAFVWLFPNDSECSNFSALLLETCDHIVQKRGSKGCRMGVFQLPATVREVVDVTGAGDIFMAGFVWAWSLKLPAEDCLRLANALAGESCRHIGTYVVPRQFATEALGKLRAFPKSGPPSPGCFLGSSPLGTQPRTQSVHSWNGQVLASDDILPEDYVAVPIEVEVDRDTLLPERIRPVSPSSPTELSGTRIPSDQESSDEQDRRLR